MGEHNLPPLVEIGLTYLKICLAFLTIDYAPVVLCYETK